MLLTRSPLEVSQRLPAKRSSFDLHALSTPPAFVLSQDQTLQRKRTVREGPQSSCVFELVLRINGQTIIRSDISALSDVFYSSTDLSQRLREASAEGAAQS